MKSFWINLGFDEATWDFSGLEEETDLPTLR
jgi:hypothetical protein